MFAFKVALRLSSGASVGGTSYSCLCVHLKKNVLCMKLLLVQVIRSSWGVGCNLDLPYRS